MDAEGRLNPVNNRETWQLFGSPELEAWTREVLIPLITGRLGNLREPQESSAYESLNPVNNRETWQRASEILVTTLDLS